MIWADTNVPVGILSKYYQLLKKKLVVRNPSANGEYIEHIGPGIV